MSKYSIDSTTLTNIGNAIREKDGTSAPIQVSDFATRITNIPGGGGGEVSNIVYPYDTCSNFNTLMSTSYYTFSKIVIPYSVWSQYKTITFNYTADSQGAPMADLSGCYANLQLYFGKVDETKMWQTNYNPTFSQSLLIANIFTDFSGKLSDSYTINCNNLVVTDTNNKDIVLVVQGKRHSTSDRENLFSYKIGNFRGIKK